MEQNLIEFKLGDIVALRTHPYFTNITSIVISGEAQLISPLMVITEIVKESEKYDEKTGEAIISKGQMLCKCIWYSTKSSKFEDEWISSKLLKLIQSSEEFTSEFGPGNIVALRTLKLELQKKKSSVSLEEEGEVSKTNITALLPFVSPTMQVLQKIELKNSDIKDSIFDSKKGFQRRFFSNIVYKCRWFNSHLDKASEITLSGNVLTIIGDSNEEFIKRIVNKIKQPAYYRFTKTETNIEHNLEQSIVRPLRVKYLHGFYKVSVFDYILCKVVEFDLVEESLTEIEKPYLFKAPDFKHKTGDSAPTKENIVIEITEAITKAQAGNLFITIKYLDYNDKLTLRSLKDYEIVELIESGDTILYLTGFCFLRKDKRTFRMDRIQAAYAIDLKYK